MTFLQVYAFFILPLIVLALGVAAVVWHEHHLNKTSHEHHPAE